MELKKSNGENFEGQIHAVNVDYIKAKGIAFGDILVTGEEEFEVVGIERDRSNLATVNLYLRKAHKPKLS